MQSLSNSWRTFIIYHTDISFNRDIIMDWKIAFQQTFSFLHFSCSGCKLEVDTNTDITDQRTMARNLQDFTTLKLYRILSEYRFYFKAWVIFNSQVFSSWKFSYWKYTQVGQFCFVEKWREQLVTFFLDHLRVYQLLILVLMVPWKEYTDFNYINASVKNPMVLDRSKCISVSVNAGARCERSFNSVRVLKDTATN